MKRLRITLAVLVLAAIAAPLFADSGTTRLENRLKGYFNDLLLKVEQTNYPAEKRALLNESLDRFLTATGQVRKLSFVNQEQRDALARLDAVVQEKHDELNGAAGFAMVANADLDQFAQYMVQDLEQAATYYLALSGLAIVLIIVLLIILI